MLTIRHLVVALAAIMAVDVGVSVQSTGQTPAASTAPKTAPKTDTKLNGPATAVEHLTQAKSILQSIPPDTVSGPAQPKLTELRRRFAELEERYRTGGKSTMTSADTQQGNTRFTIKETTDWSAQVVEVDRLVGELLGAPALGSMTSEVKVAEGVARRLRDFRKHLTAFAAAATGTVGARPATPVVPQKPNSESGVSPPNR